MEFILYCVKVGIYFESGRAIFSDKSSYWNVPTNTFALALRIRPHYKDLCTGMGWNFGEWGTSGKIPSIKLIRMLSGDGLKEAKDAYEFVEHIVQNYPKEQVDELLKFIKEEY